MEKFVNIGQSIHIKGELTGNEDLTIEGKVEGKVFLKDHNLTIGTNGKITIPEPWLCRYGHLELERDGVSERMPADPSGRFGLSSHFDNDDAYRIEFQNASRLIIDGTAPTFGRADAIDQAAAIEAVRQAATTGARIALPAPTAPQTSTHGEPS